MLTIKKLLWFAYVLILSFFIARKIYNLVVPSSPVFFYYLFLRAFDPIFYIPYILNCLQVVFNLIHLVPLVLYLLSIPTQKRHLWQMLLILRLVFDVFGHTYEIRSLTALYYANPLLCIIIAAQSIVTYIPSYAACYFYAFRKSRERIP